MNRKIFSIAFTVAALVLLGIATQVGIGRGIFRFMRWTVVFACAANIYNLWQYKNSWKRLLIIPLVFIIIHFIYGKGPHAAWLDYDLGTMAVLALCLFVT